MAVGHLQRHWPEIAQRFDTIVVDEAQDFGPPGSHSSNSCSILPDPADS
ncbi:MAG: hypothetical protein R2713_12230 [Ilumatobacteraceae bacterium]